MSALNSLSDINFWYIFPSVIPFKYAEKLHPKKGLGASPLILAFREPGSTAGFSAAVFFCFRKRGGT